MSSVTAQSLPDVSKAKDNAKKLLPRENRRFSRSHGVTDKQMAVLTARFPDWDFKFGSGAIHPHAVGATERAITEQLLYEQITRKHGNEVAITDIGGNANRHFMAGRANVHSCNPVLSAADAVRRQPGNYVPGAAYCNLRSSDCTLSPDVYLAVHSIYYLTKDEVLSHLHRSKLKRFYASAHEFNSLYGKMHVVDDAAESTYEVFIDKDEMMVHMQVDGNHTGYTHSACLWLNETNYYSSKGKAMAWNSSKIGDTYLYEFVDAPLGLVSERARPMPLCDSLNRKDHYGPTDGMVAYGDQAELRPTLMKLALNHQRIVSCGPFTVSFSTGRSAVLIPKDIVVYVGNQMVGKERNEKTLQSCIHLMRCALKKFAIPEGMKSTCLTYGSAMAFVYSIKDEIHAFNNLCKPTYKRLFAQLTRALSFQDLFCCSVGVEAEITPSSRRETARDVCSAYDLSKVTPVIVGSFNGREAWPKGLPGVESTMPLKEMDAKATISELEEQDPRIEYAPQFHVNCPIFTPIQVVVPNPSKNNEQRALVNRALVKTPVEDSESWKAVHSYARYHAKLVDPVVDPYDHLFLSWNAKFPEAAQKLNRTAYAKVLESGLTRHDLKMKMFVKRETTLKTGEEFEDFDPRAIQGCSAEMNVSYGPFIWRLSKNLGSVWNADNRICYTSGMTAEEIGDWRGDFGEDDDLTIIELDESRYDAHQSLGAHVCSGLLKKAGGMRDYDLPTFVENNVYRKVGTSRHFRYAVDGTMTSGKADTSLSNSFMNGCKLDCLLRRFGFADTEYKMLVNGDDSLVVVRRSLTTKRREALKEYLVRENRKLGFTTKCKVRTDWHEVEYCSGLFWPVERGYVLGPKIGRRLPKMGFGLRQLDEAEVKSMVTGMRLELGHLPILSLYVAACERFTKTIKTKPGVTYVDKEAQYKNQVSIKHKSSAATSVFFEARYGISLTFCELSFTDCLSQLQTITDCVHFPLMHVFAVDL